MADTTEIKVDIESLRADLRAMKEVNKKAEDFIKENPAATKEEIEQVDFLNINLLIQLETLILKKVKQKNLQNKMVCQTIS